MKPSPHVRDLSRVTHDEATAYLNATEGDEVNAAFLLAKDRNALEGSSDSPDEAEVHHALFLLRRALGKDAPSFDSMRIRLRELRELIAA